MSLVHHASSDTFLICLFKQYKDLLDWYISPSQPQHPDIDAEGCRLQAARVKYTGKRLALLVAKMNECTAMERLGTSRRWRRRK